MVRPWTFVEPLLVPIAVVATVVALAAQYLVAGLVNPMCWAGIGVVWLVGVLIREQLRKRRLEPLLAQPARQIRVLASDFNVQVEGAARDEREDADPLAADVHDRILHGVNSRRLVLLEGHSGIATAAAFELLQREFPSHIVLRPSVRLSADSPPLSELLTSGAPSLRDRYILWLGDISVPLDAGLDPRIIERWLAIGRSRIAIGTIGTATLDRLTSSGSPVAAPLGRAFRVGVGEGGAPATIAERYRAASQAQRPQAAVLMRLVATWRRLGITMAPERGIVLDAVSSITGQQVARADVARACKGPGAPVEERDGVLEPQPELVNVIDQEAAGRTDPAILNVLTGLVHENAEDLLAMGRALGHRGQLDEARQLIKLAERVATDRVRPAITSAWVDLVELKDPSGAVLGNVGGLDFEEPMGPDQRLFAQSLLPLEPDDVFDPTSPPETERWRARFYRLTLRRAAVRAAVLMLIDANAIIIASWCALAVRASARGLHVKLIDEDLGKLIVSAVPATIAIAVWVGLYKRDAARARLPQILGTMSLLCVLVTAGFFVADVAIGSMTALGVLFVAAVTADWGLRAAYDEISRSWVRRHHFQNRVLILGAPRDIRPFARNLKRQGGQPVQIVACLSPQGSDDPFDVGQYAHVHGAGNYGRLEAMLHELHIGQLVIADRSLSTTQKGRLTSRAHRMGVDVRLVANDNEIILGAVGRLDEDSLVRAPAGLLSPEAHELKRLLDRFVVTVTLPVWASIILIYAAHSRLRRRGQPVFVAADRVGLGGTGFRMVRLRTRTWHDDRTRGKCPTGRIESFMERSGLDEIPQVINVLRGEMTLVGPRPLSARVVAELSADQRRTLSVRPGMTGPWQVSRSFGRSEAEMRAADANYLRQWRVLHDIAIILRTPVAVVRRGVRYLGDTELARQRSQVLRGAPRLSGTELSA
jgi:lipopolysaccharide/colanic/teichoic acid biosynthesis glycosyltransferase